MTADRGKVRGVDFISAPNVRSSRPRFGKTPLRRPNSGFWAWLLSLFSRRPRPFIASAIADDIDQEQGFSRGVIAGDPLTSLATGSTALESVAGRLLGFGREACTRADEALDSMDDSLRLEEHWLDDCRPESIVKALRARLKDAEAETTAELRGYVASLVKARTNFEEFKARHRLDDDVGFGKPLDAGVAGQLGVLFLLEFVLNSTFQAGLLKDGLLGGVSFAFFTSLATIIVGLTLGVGVQRRALPFERGGWQGYLVLFAGALAALLIVSELSLIRLAGDAGDLRALQTSVTELSANPFAGVGALLELPALAYSIFILFLIASVAIKYLTYAGHYPNYRKHGLKLEEAVDRTERLLAAARDEIRAIGEEHKVKLHKAPDFIVSCKAPIRTLVADHENAIDQFSLDTADIRTAARLFDAFIGEHGGPAAGELEQRAAGDLAPFAAQLSERHARFEAKADELCGREDVADATVDAARTRFAVELDQACTRLNDTHARLLDEVRLAHHADSSWRPPSLGLAAAAQ